MGAPPLTWPGLTGMLFRCRRSGHMGCHLNRDDWTSVNREAGFALSPPWLGPILGGAFVSSHLSQ